MHGTQFSKGFQLNPIAKGAPEALVVLLCDLGTSIETGAALAARWAASVPAAAFIVLDGIRQSKATPDAVRNTIAEPRNSAEPDRLDRAGRSLVPLVAQALRTRRLDASRLVLVGFGSGATLALHLVLHQGWSSAGVLAFAPALTDPPPRAARRGPKIRLIDSVGNSSGAHAGARDLALILVDRGIDVRRVRLGGPMLSDEAVRHGALYLAELVATAQWGARLPAVGASNA